MSLEHPTFLYIGSHETQFKQSLPVDPHFFAAHSTTEALAMTVHFLPDVVVIDVLSPWAREVYAHLHSIIDGGPVVILASPSMACIPIWVTPPVYLYGKPLTTAILHQLQIMYPIFDFAI